jgi:hypothetical protein
MREKERLKEVQYERHKEAAPERRNATEPHPARGVLARYAEGALDSVSAAHVRVHMLDCRACRLEASLREELEQLLDLAAPDAGTMKSVVFELSGLPSPRKSTGPGDWWDDPKSAAGGPWLVHGSYRLALDRPSRDMVTLCLREGDQPRREALVVLERAGPPGTPELARAVTNERGEAKLRLGEVPPPARGSYRIRVLIATG